MPIYQIRLKEQLDSHWSAWFGGLTVTTEANGETLLTGEVVDQAALHGLLSKIRDLQLTLISVYPLKDYLTDRLSGAYSSPPDEAKPSRESGVSGGLSRGSERSVGSLHTEGASPPEGEARKM